MVAAQQSSRQRRTHGRSAFGMAASLHRLRLSLPLHRRKPQWRSCPSRWLRHPFDFPSHEYDHINRVGFEYQGDYSERTWAHTTFGYRIENENGIVGDRVSSPNSRPASESGCLSAAAADAGQAVRDCGRAIRPQQRIRQYGRAAGCSNSAGVARRRIFSGTRLRFSYATGFMEPALYQTFAGLPYYVPNPGLLPERTRAFEAGIQQNLLAGRWALNATYFNNLFHDQIELCNQSRQPVLASFSMCSNLSLKAPKFSCKARIWTEIVAEHRLHLYLDPDICRLRSAHRRIFAILCLPREIPCSAAPSIRQQRSSAIWGRAGAQIWAEASWADVRIPILRTSTSTTPPATLASILADGMRSTRESRPTRMSRTHSTITTTKWWDIRR